ncbi:hypothetical protein [Malonomonas rubra]|uniref:hypothetical protein n=1 Tax=Malonomonas rubra TaxID=57040 RepID=UPI0026EB2D87|nr:hypothetical protein [Malonomonas rubra]
MLQFFRTYFQYFQSKPTATVTMFGRRLLAGAALLLLFLLPQGSMAALVDLLSVQQLSQMSGDLIIIDARPIEA